MFKHLVEIDNSQDKTRVPRNEDKEKILQMFLKENGKDSIMKAYDRDRCLYTKEQLRLPAGTVQWGRSVYSVVVTFQSEHDLRSAHANVRSADESCPIMDVIFQTAVQTRLDSNHLGSSFVCS